MSEELVREAREMVEILAAIGSVPKVRVLMTDLCDALERLTPPDAARLSDAEPVGWIRGDWPERAKGVVRVCSTIYREQQCDDDVPVYLAPPTDHAALVATCAKCGSRSVEVLCHSCGDLVPQPAPQAEPCAWRSMATTTPNDGERILGYWPDDPIIETVEWDDRFYREVGDLPTHWMPLPPAPIRADEGDKS